MSGFSNKQFYHLYRNLLEPPHRTLNSIEMDSFSVADSFFTAADSSILSSPDENVSASTEHQDFPVEYDGSGGGAGICVVA